MDVSEFPLTPGRYLIEASAGTGKTYTITHLVRRLILQRVPVREILVTTFSKAAAAELKARILKLLNEELNRLRPQAEDGSGEAAEQTSERVGGADAGRASSDRLLLMQAVSSIDEMTVSTIHGFCQKMLREFVLDSKLDFEPELIPDASDCADRLLRAFCREKFYGGGEQGTPDFDLYRRAARYAEDEIDECPPVDESRPESVAREAYLYVRERLQEEKAKAGTITFNDLIRIFCGALDGSPGLAKRIRSRYRAVFVDEFQDTDRLQYSIFDRCFPADGDSIFYMIGDPKQAIYGFRGADIYTYLRAKRSAGETSFTLTENFRSSPAMIRAVNLMFGDGCTETGHRSKAVFLQDGIPFVSVASGRPAEDFPQNDGAALRLSRYEGKKDACEAEIKKDVVRDIRRLLSDDRPMTVFEEQETDGKKVRVFRPLRASDIAILVQKHDQAADFVRMLNREGIAASACKSGRIFDTREAKVMLLLLKAFLQPDMQTARGLMLSPFFRYSCDDILRHPARAESALKLLADCGDVWRKSGLPAAFLGFLDTPCGDGATPRVRILSESNGERALTNYLHLMELLYQEEEEGHARPEDILNALNLACGGHGGIDGKASVDDTEDNPDQLRLDRDAASVQILTMFTAKGLEFPVVFVPFPALTDISRSISRETAYRVNTAADGGTEASVVLDFGKGGVTKRMLQEETLRSAVRLLYVALTRATLATYLYVQQLPDEKSGRGGAPVNFVKSAQGVLLRDKHLPDDTPESIRAWKDYFFTTRDKRPDVCAGWYSGLFPEPGSAGKRIPGGSSGAEDMPVFELLRDRPATPDGAGNEVLPPLRSGSAEQHEMEALTPPVIPDNWRVMSFSAFHTLLTDRADKDTESPADYDAEDVVTEEISMPEKTPLPATPPANAFRNFPHGKQSGTLTHELLEYFATHRPSAQDGPGADVSCFFNLFADETGTGRRIVMSRIEDALKKQAFRPENGPALYDGISYALRTPLPGLGIPLCGITRNRMTAEMEFFLDAPASLDLQRILSILKEGASGLSKKHLPDYRRTTFDKQGVLNGIVDLIFEYGGKYYIVDWKTNWLGNSDSDYTPPRIASAMGSSGYILQSYLYAAGLLRMLRQRGPGDGAFGGIYYLFLRGLDGHSKNGIWQDVPPMACLEKLLTLFQGDRRT